MTRKTFLRDVELLGVLIAVHVGLEWYLADGAIVSALFTPGGAHSVFVLITAAIFIVVRVVLLVGVPGWLVAQAFLFAAHRLREKRAAP